MKKYLKLDIKSDLKYSKSIKSEYILNEILLFLGRKRLFNVKKAKKMKKERNIK